MKSVKLRIASQDVRKHVIALVALASFCAWTPTVAIADDGPRACRVKSATTEARIQHDAKSEPLKLGQLLGNADKLITGPAGRVHIVCADRSTFVIGANTEVDFRKLTDLGKEESFIVRLSHGIMGFIVPLLGAKRFEVHTPSAVASVRSTEWTVDTNDTGSSVFVRKGSVGVRELNPSGQSVVLRRGEGVVVTISGGVEPVKTWGEKRIVQMNNRLGFEWK